jgi:GNAT superfamily N-acetyltransferase
MLADGFHDIPKGKIATVVTHLEMCEEVAQPSAQLPNGTRLGRVSQPEVDWYRELYLRVGGRDWLWFSRMQLPDDALRGILNDPGIQVFAVERNGTAEGLLELDFRDQGACELAFLGLSRDLIGLGIGRAMMNFAIETAWQRPIELLHIHTCTLDSPQALGFYRKCGFVPVRQQIEVVDDPRLTGVLPRDAGPHVPNLDVTPARSAMGGRRPSQAPESSWTSTLPVAPSSDPRLASCHNHDRSLNCPNSDHHIQWF